MEAEQFRPFTLGSVLTDYIPLPRALMSADLASTAKLIYAFLLDRATLSRKNSYADAGGKVYAICSIENLAHTFQISDTAVKRHLKALQERGLIFRSRDPHGRFSRIYVNLPSGAAGEGTFCRSGETGGGTFYQREGAKSSRQTGRKVPTNNKKEQQDLNDYYQHGEDESL